MREDLGCAAAAPAGGWWEAVAPEGVEWKPRNEVRLVGPIAIPGPLSIFKRSDLLVGRISRVAALANFDNLPSKAWTIINSAPCDMNTALGAVH